MHACAYYNDNDPFCCEWLRNLIAAGLIAPGDVDCRSIKDVQPDDLRGYTQCHFFAGIGGWSYALRLAGWPDDRPVWTGSCPCQDFSLVGKRKAFAGERDLRPLWFKLIRECRPYRIFGEQVDDAPQWCDRAVFDLEKLGYACGEAIIPAIAVAAPHERLRYYFVADADKARWSHSTRKSASEKGAKQWRSAGLVHCQHAQSFRWPSKPNKDWVVDGLSGEGLAVGAYGNAIVPQVAAEFIRAFCEI